MATLISIITFSGFYLLYTASQKMVAVDNLGFEKWIGRHINFSKYSGLALLIVSLGLSCFHWGTGSGTFTFLIMLMTIASLIVLLAPLRILNRRFLTLVFVVLFICEITLL